MSEKLPIRKIEKEDIIIPTLGAGDTSIVFQRHGEYDRHHDSETAGSITKESAEDMFNHNKIVFDDLFRQEDVYVLFAASDASFADKGYRSMETARVAQDAATQSLEDLGLNPNERIINFNPKFSIASHKETDSDVRPLAGIRDPQVFNPRDIAYINHLQEVGGYADVDNKKGLSPNAWGIHEVDGAHEARELTGAESQAELIKRTKKTLAILERYAHVWHANNPGKKLVIWTSSHYDTISPIVKEVDGLLYDENGQLTDVYQPVNYGAGVVINIPKSPEDDVTLTRRASERVLKLGKEAATERLSRDNITSPTKLDQPRY